MTFDAIRATAVNGDVREVQLRGTGSLGKRWEVHISSLDEVWRADLDGNGTQDYVLFAGGPYFNGRTTPLFSLSILLMDRQGMPLPFFTALYRGANGDGIKHLVDLNHDGKAELLVATYDEVASDAGVGPFCSGHWTNQLYGFNDSGAEEIRGRMGGITFPLIHDWSYRGTGCPSSGTLSPVRPAPLYDRGTSAPGVSTRILKAENATDRITIEPVGGCKMITPKVVVYDREQLRQIAFPNQFSPYMTNLADQLRRNKAHVELRGIDRSTGIDDCPVNLMWAK